MPNWNTILNEINAIRDSDPEAPAVDLVRRKYLDLLFKHTGRNTIIYHSGWLIRKAAGVEINDDDKNGLMTAVHGLDRSLGLDLILHTPGGDIAATESLVHYLRSIFGTDIRAIVPQIAMSAGTMIACSCKSIVMGKQSNLGPIDPQMNGLPTQAILDEFEVAIERVKQDPAAIPIWQKIIEKYHPTLIGECQRAIVWSQTMVRDWLESGMFKADQDGPQKAAQIVDLLSSHEDTMTHSRHIHIEDCIKMGLRIERLEDDQTLQDLVLSVHHASYQSGCFKFIENHKGIGYFRGMPQFG